MANTKITDLNIATATSLAAGDKFVVVDISDTSMASSGTTKAIVFSELAEATTTSYVFTSALVGASFTTSSNVSSDITGLSFDLAANEVWVAQFDLYGNCDNTGGIKVEYGAPAGATLESTLFGNSNSTTAFKTQRLSAASTKSDAFWTVGTTDLFLSIHLTVVNGGTAGTFQLKGLSATNTQTTTLYEGSSLRAFRVA